MKNQAIAFEKKIISPQTLTSIGNNLIRPLVFTNGCFDILHRGHVTYLAEAKNYGQTLVVALNSDDSVKRQGKGKDRPINCLANRLAVIAALESVDYVTWFAEDTPFELINSLQPNVLIKGGDWSVEQIVGADVVLQNDGQVISIPFQYHTSTTQTIEKIKSIN